MTNKITTPHDTKKQAKVTHPGMLGDGTEEQNLGQRGNPAARIKKKEVTAAFGKQRPKKIALTLISVPPLRRSGQVSILARGIVGYYPTTSVFMLEKNPHKIAAIEKTQLHLQELLVRVHALYDLCLSEYR